MRIHGTMRPQIKYIAAYQVHPVCAITHIAPVKSIEPWKDTGKFVVNFFEPAREIRPIPSVRAGRVPRELGEFVIVHELAHLLAPNHGKVFKSFMCAYMPGTGSNVSDN